MIGVSDSGSGHLACRLSLSSRWSDDLGAVDFKSDDGDPEPSDDRPRVPVAGVGSADGGGEGAAAAAAAAGAAAKAVGLRARVPRGGSLHAEDGVACVAGRAGKPPIPPAWPVAMGDACIDRKARTGDTERREEPCDPEAVGESAEEPHDTPRFGDRIDAGDEDETEDPCGAGDRGGRAGAAMADGDNVDDDGDAADDRDAKGAAAPKGPGSAIEADVV
jgi:hypothetical protein